METAMSWCTVCGEGLCESCEECHRLSEITSKHLTLPIEELSKNTEATIGGIHECSEHPGKTTEFDYEHNSKPSCELCAKISHTMRESAISIEAAATGIKQTKKATELAERLSQKSSNISELIKNRNDEIRKVKTESITQKDIDLENDSKVLMSKLTTENISFKRNTIISEFPTNVETFRNNSVEILTTNTTREIPTVNFRGGNINVLQTIKTGSWGNSGIFVNDFMILTDYRNKRIMKYDENYSCIRSLLLPTNVSDITHIENDIVAVASASSKTIYIIDTKLMTLIRTITTPTIVYGLQYVDGHFIVAYDNTLTWISLAGEKIKEQKTNRDTYFICTTGKNSYICADGKNSVSVTTDGNKTFTYIEPTLKLARGIDVDFEGNIYIIGCYSRNIHQLTSTGRHIRTISTTKYGKDHPWVLRFKPKSSTFLLTSRSTGKVLICYIK